MKYKAVIETDDYKGFEFFEDGIGKYMVGRDAGATDFGGGGWIPLYFTECEEESETVTEFADRCRECGAKYGKLLKQEPKTGRWIGHREHCENLGVMPSGLGAYEWCSNCDCGIDVREWHRNHYNYCPNCGAKMKSEE